MSYSDLYFRSKRPSPILYVLAVIAVGGFFLTFFRSNVPVSRAAKQSVQYHIVANVNAKSAVIFYKTDQPVQSWVIYGKDPQKLDRIAVDDRDTSDNKTSSVLHYIPLKDLDENSTYSYKIVVNNNEIIDNNNEAFTLTTTKSTSINTTAIEPAYGKVVGSNGTPVNNAFVILLYPDAHPLVAQVKNGDWLIALNGLIGKNTGKSLPANTAKSVRLEIMSEEQLLTTIDTTLKNITPLARTVVIGQQYVINGDDNVLPAFTTATEQAGISQTRKSIQHLVIPPTATGTPLSLASTIDVSYPQQGALIASSHPLIRGTALPNHEVYVAITTKPSFATKVQSDKNGDWKVNLPLSLNPGNYRMTMNTKNARGASIEIVRTFSIAKSGEGVLGTATGPATITPTEPVATPTQIIITPTLPLQLTSTPQPTYGIPTEVPTVSLPTTTPPVTGSNSTYFIVGSAALVIVGTGILLLL